MFLLIYQTKKNPNILGRSLNLLTFVKYSPAHQFKKKLKVGDNLLVTGDDN